ncbi:DNA repair exonuclease [Schnuerera sp. xch1]|uniref:metallophosphoesterase family protein n=1 Tax=Schnuerera sp. xch1 TaxID=2874283 RepID=UPI001CC06D7C|nr:DNA repair exonuclease [Schnuerera sp. xch1]MBZ2174559.1 DNA repair exonuclease [Schnuerera sp. xch1]
MVKFIHTGDLHLGLQFKGVSFSGEKANKRRLELWDTFERIIDKGIQENVDFLFIAGDLFEEKYFTLMDINRVKDTLSRAENIDIIITAGNHDTLNKNSLYNLVDWPDNVTIFGTEGLSKKEFLNKNTNIYGYSWDKGENNEDVFNDFEDLDTSKINILIIHGDIFSKDSVYLPLDKNYLSQLEFDYVGLGHIHKPNLISNKMAYCGSPEPLDFGEIGQHGIIQGTVENKNTTIEFIPFSNRIFLEKTIVLDETLSYLDIIDRIKECDDVNNLSNNLYRIKLEGVINRDIEINISDIIESLSNYFYHLEIIDNIIIDYDLEGLEEDNRDNIIGYFIREMKKKDLENKVNKDALYIGLEVLMKGKVGI